MVGYIDAASGGMIVAAVAGGLAGLRVAVKSLVPGRRRKGSSDAAANAESSVPQQEAAPTDPR